VRALFAIAVLAALLSSGPPVAQARAASRSAPRAGPRAAARRRAGPAERLTRGQRVGERAAAVGQRGPRARRGPRGATHREPPRRGRAAPRPRPSAPPVSACPTCGYGSDESQVEDALFLALGVALILGAWTFVVLALLNWVRTRRLAVFLLCYSVTSLLLYAAGRSWSGGGTWMYPGIVVTLGLVLLLTRLWPRWRLLRRPAAGRVPPPLPVARGVLYGREWPLRANRGITTVAVLVSFVMVLVMAAGAVSCFLRGMHVDSYARTSLVANALLEGELERLRAGAVAPSRLSADLSARAERLLPQGRATAAVTRGPTPGLRRVDLEVIWRGFGRPTHRATLSALVFEAQEERAK